MGRRSIPNDASGEATEYDTTNAKSFTSDAGAVGGSGGEAKSISKNVSEFSHKILGIDPLTVWSVISKLSNEISKVKGAE